MIPLTPISREEHLALHLAHRWFAYLEAPGGDLQAHLQLFHPAVQLSGHRLRHLFARDHQTLIDWFAAVPDEISSHHILHADYRAGAQGLGLLNMVVAYQAPSPEGMQGSIISYETQIEFVDGAARFVALDKTPILPNRKASYETSWSTHRVLACLHAHLAGLCAPDAALREALAGELLQVSAHASAAEACPAYTAVVTLTLSDGGLRTLRLSLTDDPGQPLPRIEQLDTLGVC